MPYVASTERMGIEQGRQEERSRQRSLILRQLVRQVGAVPEPLTDRISKLPIEQLESLAEALLEFTQF